MLARRAGVASLAIALAGLASACHAAIEFDEIQTQKYKPATRIGTTLGLPNQTLPAAVMLSERAATTSDVAAAVAAAVETRRAVRDAGVLTAASAMPSMPGAVPQKATIASPISLPALDGGPLVASGPDLAGPPAAASMDGAATAAQPSAEAVPEPGTLLIWTLAALCGVCVFRLGRRAAH